ncbi:MAG TPA: zinc ribbon domain-containing protein [Candidatus Sulfotelmatobacter sp.]|nr:zinc ribbon domain-containing protein [Candidatus Sulfotelmatobacter sp.]
MFCDRCGASVEAGQAFCSKCGKQIVGPISVMQSYPGRVQQHVHLLGILWLAMSALNAVGAIVLLMLGNVLFPHLREMKDVPSDVPVGFLTALFTTLGIIVLAKAALGFFAGWGLMQRETWARVLVLVLAFISLFNIPFGTAIGVYTLWVLLPGQSQQEYDAWVAAKAA